MFFLFSTRWHYLFVWKTHFSTSSTSNGHLVLLGNKWKWECPPEVLWAFGHIWDRTKRRARTCWAPSTSPIVLWSMPQNSSGGRGQRWEDWQEKIKYLWKKKYLWVFFYFSLNNFRLNSYHFLIAVFTNFVFLIIAHQQQPMGILQRPSVHF